MQEILLEEQMRVQLSLHEQSVMQQQQQQQQHQQPHQKRPRKVKKVQQPKVETIDVSESLKNEIEYMPMKTPISILQELLSRRGMDEKIIDFFFLKSEISIKILN
jgi:hypothetical protein